MPADDETLSSVLSMDTITGVGDSTTLGTIARVISTVLHRPSISSRTVDPQRYTILGVEAYGSLTMLDCGVALIGATRSREAGRNLVGDVQDRLEECSLWTQLDFRDVGVTSGVRAAGVPDILSRGITVEEGRLRGVSS